MVKLPDKSALGPLTIRPSPPVSYAGITDGQGLQAVGKALSGIGAEEQQRQDALDLIKADADYTQGMYSTVRSFDEDPDYKTYGPRFDAERDKIINDSAAGIQNGYTRQKFIEQARQKSAIYGDRVARRATQLGRQDEFITIDDSLRKKRADYLDPNNDDDTRSRLLTDMDAAITAGQRTGLLDPLHAKRLRDTHLGGAQADDAESRMWTDPEGLLKELNSYRPPQSQAPEVQPIPGRALGRGARTAPIEGVVIHHTSGSDLNGALSQGRMAGTGANYYIDRDGTVYQGAPEDQYTAHIQPPDSKYRNGNNPNLSSLNTVGIEVVAKNDKDVTPEQRDAIQKLTTDVATRHSIKPENVIGHGDIQGGPGGNKEPDEGVAAAQTYRDAAGTVRLPSNQTAQADTGTKSDVEVTPLEPISPGASRYDRLTPNQRHALITRAKQALSDISQQAVKDDLARMDRGEDPQPDTSGRTSLQKAAAVLTPNQYAKYERVWNEKRMGKAAIHGVPDGQGPQVLPLSDLDDAQASERISSLTPKRADTESYQSASRVQDQAEKAYQKIQDWRVKDPAQAVSGGKVGGASASNLSVDENGQILVRPGDDTELKSRPSPEVSAALSQIRGRLPSVQLTDDGQGGVVVSQDRADPQQLARATNLLFNARLAAQQRLGVPPGEQRIITLSEAQNLLGLRNTSGLSVDAVDTAKSKAAQLYGDYAKRALTDAVKLTTKDRQKREADTDVATGLLNGTLSADKLFPRTGDQSFMNRFFGAGSPPPTWSQSGAESGSMTSVSPPANFDPWMGANQGRPGIASDYQPTQPTGGNLPTDVQGVQTSQPISPAHLQWLQQHNDSAGRAVFKAKFGAAADPYLRELSGNR